MFMYWLLLRLCLPCFVVLEIHLNSPYYVCHTFIVFMVWIVKIGYEGCGSSYMKVSYHHHHFVCLLVCMYVSCVQGECAVHHSWQKTNPQ
ncbi:hypothetical protein FKM82_011090 [Ascaphus truei]